MIKMMFACIVLIMFCGCTENATKVNKNEGSISIQTNLILLDYVTLNQYERGVTTYLSDSNTYFAAYNRQTHSIDWFDILNKTIFHRTVLDRQGPNAITEQVEGIYIHTFDSIFLNDGIFLYMVNKDGKVMLNIQNYFETEIGPVYMVNSTTSALQLYPSKNRLISQALIPGNSEVYFLELDLTNESVYLHHVGNPECYSRAVGQNNSINVSYKGDSIIYNSTCSSDIFVYCTESKNTSVYNGESSLSQNRIPHIRSDNPDDLWKHIIENPRFFRVIHSPADNLYYRLHWKEAVFPSDQNPHTIAYDKPVIISVFSEDFELLYESILPKHQYLIDFLLPTPQGVMVNASHPNSANYDPEGMELHILRFEK